MIIVVEGPMGSGMTLSAVYMSYRLWKELGISTKFDFPNISEIEKTLNNMEWNKVGGLE